MHVDVRESRVSILIIINVVCVFNLTLMASIHLNTWVFLRDGKKKKNRTDSKSERERATKEMNRHEFMMHKIRVFCLPWWKLWSSYLMSSENVPTIVLCIGTASDFIDPICLLVCVIVKSRNDRRMKTVAFEAVSNGFVCDLFCLLLIH